MPMLDAYIPEGALTAEAEDRLLAELTDLLITHEGADPTNPLVRSIAWVFLHRPAAVYVAGAREVEPHYRFIASVPESAAVTSRAKSHATPSESTLTMRENDNHPIAGINPP